ncbi:hypothetical protein BJF78_22085 [Pseudonocardia sp. CNS-139]|nr:hypothetical protein BJF78_22085 [Pseudonocardia sp. CNS-139]
MSTTMRATAPATGWRMRPGTRKALLTGHIVAAGAWIGLDVMLGVLVFTAMGTADRATAALCYQVLPLLTWPLVAAALLSLLTGLLLGLGTRYGLLRHWWVATKLVLNVVLAALVLLALRPGLDAAAEYGRALLAGAAATADVSTLVYPPVVSTSALVVATVLAVYKPWGRVRRA